MSNKKPNIAAEVVSGIAAYKLLSFLIPLLLFFGAIFLFSIGRERVETPYEPLGISCRNMRNKHKTGHALSGVRGIEPSVEKVLKEVKIEIEAGTIEGDAEFQKLVEEWVVIHADIPQRNTPKVLEWEKRFTEVCGLAIIDNSDYFDE